MTAKKCNVALYVSYSKTSTCLTERTMGVYLCSGIWDLIVSMYNKEQPSRPKIISELRPQSDVHFDEYR